MNNHSLSSNKRKGLLVGKRFFIDPKVDKHTSFSVKQKLLALGGKVEEFLDKGIHFALTSESASARSSHGGERCRGSSQSPFSTTSPSVENNSNVGGRWKDLAKQASSKMHSSNMIDVAKSFGIKIRLIDDVLSWLNKKTEHLHTSGVSLPPSQPNNIKLKEPCVKVEDGRRAMKPIYDEFDSFPYLDLAVQGNKCPIINSSTLIKRTKLNEKKVVEKKGFCECCQCSYLSDRKHRKTSEHLKFGETESNFANLDQYINDENLNIDAFLTRVNGVVLSPTTNASNSNVVEETKNNEERTQTPHKLADFPKATEKSTPITTPKKCAPTRSSPRKTKPLTPCRRSPRKLVKDHLESAQTLRQTSLANENQADNPSEEISNLTLNCRIRLPENFPNDPSSYSPSKTVAAGQLNPEQLLGKNLSPTVTLCELPKCGYKRTRIQSCESAGATYPGEITDSPLSRLRSFKRKFRELNTVPGRTLKMPVLEKKSRLTGESGILPSSDSLLTLLQSSTDDPVNFQGF